jgi:hypothetical protein
MKYEANPANTIELESGGFVSVKCDLSCSNLFNTVKVIVATGKLNTDFLGQTPDN